jgi:hypothetical protein
LYWTKQKPALDQTEEHDLTGPSQRFHSESNGLKNKKLVLDQTEEYVESKTKIGDNPNFC